MKWLSKFLVGNVLWFAVIFVLFFILKTRYSQAIFLVVIFLAVLAWLFIAGVTKFRNKVTGTYNSSWAGYKELSAANTIVKPKELAKLPVATPMVFIGAVNNKGTLEPIAVKPGHAGRAELGNFLTVGPPGSGKGRAITTNLLAYPESTVVLDVKGENFQQTAGMRNKFSNVLALNPDGKGNQYDPVLHMRHSDEALKTVANIIIDPGQDKEPAFAQAAENALYAVLLAARFENAPTFPYLQALLDMGITGFVQYLSKLEDRKIQSALIRFTTVSADEFTTEFFNRNGLVRGAWGILNTRCGNFMTDGVMAMFSGNDFSPADLYNESRPTSLYLVFPEAHMNATSKAFSLIVMSLMMGMTEYYDKAAVKPKRQVLLILDEAGRVRFPDLANYLSTIRSRNLIASLYIQDLSQLEVLYKRDGAQAILAACKTQIFHPSSHEGTQGYVSRATGLVSLYEIQYDTMEELIMGGRKINEQHRPLLTPDEVRRLHPDTVVIFTGNLPPVHVARLDPSLLKKQASQAELPVLKALQWEPLRLTAPGLTRVPKEKPVEAPMKEAVEPEF